MSLDPVMERDPMLDPDPLFRFTGEYVDKDPTGYAMTRWDLATPVSVLASTKAEAAQKVWAMLGEPPRGRSWALRWSRISEVRQA